MLAGPAAPSFTPRPGCGERALRARGDVVALKFDLNDDSRPNQPTGLLQSCRSKIRLTGDGRQSRGTLRSTCNESSLDHVIRAEQQPLRHCKIQRSGSLAIDGQIEAHRSLDGQLRRFGASEDLVNVGRRAPELIEDEFSIAHQKAGAGHIHYSLLWPAIDTVQPTPPLRGGES